MKKNFRQHFLGLFSCMSLAAVVVICFLSFIAIAVATETPVAGGSGGTPYTLSCYGDQALVGIKGRAGIYIDQVQAVCAQINYDGSWQGSTTTTRDAGGSGGNSFNLTCPKGYAVTGISGKAGSNVDQLKVRCGPLDKNGRFSSLGNFLSSTAGGWGGNSFGPYNCGNYKPARMIRGSADATKWVYSIGLSCEYVDTLRPKSITFQPFPTRVGQPTSVTVTMSHNLMAPATVSLASSNTKVAPEGTVSVASGHEKATISITPQDTGCTTMTASYKGASISNTLLVHSAAPSALLFYTPTTLKFGQATNMTVSLSSTTTVEQKISLINIDSFAMQMPAQITVPAGQRSVTFQVTAASIGCARIKATNSKTGGAVTNAINVVR